ncbi:hypothetical protein [Pseudomonas sp. NFACC36]|uniref:hypothetical protein n=1 Tax=Pseudomonas sp. NFACC36 TaxID=1566197 RepID=UPI00091516C3|nr:hypothetical protein [Pseudomonas sp. NFACC36]SFY05257.1 hypothetical protein SAMN03159309_03794 [Pseudomonas sp. NFACC36]
MFEKTDSSHVQANRQIQVFDGEELKGTANVSDAGDWSLTVTGLRRGWHSFKARGLYGENPESAVRTLEVGSRSDLRRPVVVEANANAQVDPSLLPGGITVRIEYDGMQPGDQVKMVFEGTADGSATQTKSVATPPAPLEYAISQATLFPNSARTVQVFYEVTRGGLPYGESLRFPLSVLGLAWNSFTINGWNPAAFQPVTAFDGVFFGRTVSRAVAPVVYSSSKAEVTVDGSGTVTFARAWTGSVTLTARDAGGRSIAYTLNAPSKWFLMETLAIRTVAEHYQFVQANTAKGYRAARVPDFLFHRTRKVGRLWSEWGNLTVYGWSDTPDEVWLTDDPGGTVRWRDHSPLTAGEHWSMNSTGASRWWTICYRNNP